MNKAAFKIWVYDVVALMLSGEGAYWRVTEARIVRLEQAGRVW